MFGLVSEAVIAMSRDILASVNKSEVKKRYSLSRSVQLTAW